MPVFLMDDETLSEIRKADDAQLVRMATTADLGVIVEATIRLRKSNELLSKVNIWLTVAMVAMTIALVVLTYVLVKKA